MRSLNRITTNHCIKLGTQRTVSSKGKVEITAHPSIRGDSKENGPPQALAFKWRRQKCLTIATTNPDHNQDLNSNGYYLDCPQNLKLRLQLNKVLV